MEKAVVVGGNVSGNIGSCEVKSTDISISSWSYKTVAVNSCTGEIVSETQYVSYGNVFFGAIGGLTVFGVFVFIVVGGVATIMDRR